MYGIGVDIVSIQRIEKSLSKPSFVNMVYSQKEQQLFCKNGKMAVNSLGARWAAKEAFGKALGTGVRGFNLNEISVLCTENGKPYFEFCGKALEIVQQKGLTCQVSLSHEKDTAIAFVVLEQQHG